MDAINFLQDIAIGTSGPEVGRICWNRPRCYGGTGAVEWLHHPDSISRMRHRSKYAQQVDVAGKVPISRCAEGRDELWVADIVSDDLLDADLISRPRVSICIQSSLCRDIQ